MQLQWKRRFRGHAAAWRARLGRGGYMLAKYENLRVWQKAMTLSEFVYETTQAFPRRENFGLTSQMRRAAVSVPANVAEGCGRFHTRDFLHFLFVARGSLFELMTLIELSRRRQYLQEKWYATLRTAAEDVLRALSGLVNSLQERARQ